MFKTLLSYNDYSEDSALIYWKSKIQLIKLQLLFPNFLAKKTNKKIKI